MNAHEIIANLYQGAVPPSAHAVERAGVHTLVLCAREIQPPRHALGDRFRTIRCPLDDDPTRPLSAEDWAMAFRAGRSVARRVRAGHRVLVTCAQGRNRSGLVTCVALHHLTGWGASRCIQHVQHRRPHSCGNPRFNEALLERL